MTKLSDIIGLPKTTEDAEKVIFAYCGQEYPNRMSSDVRNVIWKLAIRQNIVPPHLMPGTPEVGAPRKWCYTPQLLILWLRTELAMLTRPPRTKKSTVYSDIKDKYGYSESAKRPGNLYTNAPRDPFVRQFIDATKYYDMPLSERIAYLKNIVSN